MKLYPIHFIRRIYHPQISLFQTHGQLLQDKTFKNRKCIPKIYTRLYKSLWAYFNVL